MIALWIEDAELETLVDQRLGDGHGQR
jgi:hypothetical protein